MRLTAHTAAPHPPPRGYVAAALWRAPPYAALVGVAIGFRRYAPPARLCLTAYDARYAYAPDGAYGCAPPASPARPPLMVTTKSICDSFLAFFFADDGNKKKKTAATETKQMLQKEDGSDRNKTNAAKRRRQRQKQNKCCKKKRHAKKKTRAKSEPLSSLHSHLSTLISQH